MARWIAAATLTLAGLPLTVAVLFAALVAGACPTLADGDGCTASHMVATGDIDLPRPAGATGPITSGELAAIGDAIGQPVPAYSILRDPSTYGTGWGGPSVNLLAPAMKVAVARLELAMGARLQLWSGYRTTGYQAQLCRQVSGPCADPGESMHQYGLAVDAINWGQALPYLEDVGLCQPLPTNDANHLSHVTGREC